MSADGKPGQRSLERAIAIVHILERLNEHEVIEEDDLGHALDVVFDDLGDVYAEIMHAEPERQAKGKIKAVGS